MSGADQPRAGAVDCDFPDCTPVRPCGECLLIAECEAEQANGLIEGGMAWP